MNFKTLVSAASLTLLLAGCQDQGFKKTKGGLPYKQYTKSGAAKVKSTDWLKLNYILTMTVGGKDSTLLSTWEQKSPRYVPVNGPTQPYDVSEIIPMVHKGDSIVVVQAMDTLINRSPQMVPPFFKKGGKLTYRLKVEDVYPSQAAASDDETKSREEAFRNDTKLQAKIKEDQARIQQSVGADAAKLQQTSSGAYVLPLTTTAGSKPAKGKFASVYYTGRTLSGVVFDSNVDTSMHRTEPLIFQVGAGQMIRGFDEAIQLMGQGEKARVFLPSPLGYGENPPPGGKIGPNEILVFDVELRNITDTDPRVGPMPQGH